MAVDPVQIVVAESTPPLLDLTAHLLPLARQDVLIHSCVPPWKITSEHFQIEQGACPRLCRADDLRTLLAGSQGQSREELTAAALSCYCPFSNGRRRSHGRARDRRRRLGGRRRLAARGR